MTMWSKHPPRRPCFAFFRGVRQTLRNQTIAIAEPVQVLAVRRGRGDELAISMFGRQQCFQLAQFRGEWLVWEAQP